MLNNQELQKICSHSIQELREIVSWIEEAYTRFPLSKGNGKIRWITAPNEKLKAIQHHLLYQFLYQVMPHESAHGFVPERSIVTNAQPHVGQRMVGNFDISNFFPSTKEKQVKEIFIRHYNLEEGVAELLTGLCCLRGELPQGAPTSPHLANLAMWDADHRLQELAEEHNLNFTRYADDMTFSGDWMPEGISEQVEEIISDYGYHLAPHKIRFYGQNKRQMVTGLVVNEKLSLPRALRRRLRAILYDMEQNGAIQALERADLSEDQLQGFFSLQFMWNEEEARAQMEQLRELLKSK